MTTIVTAFYEMSSKFSSDKYWKWFMNFAQVPCNLVVFTSLNLVNKVLSIRSSNIHVIPVEFKDLYHYRFIEKYREHYKKDYYKNHSPELYIIWAEKVKFVIKTILLNPFNTEKFVWCDFGAFRTSQKHNGFANASKIVDNKMNFLLLEHFTAQDKIISNGIMGQPYGTVRLGGGIQGADKNTWLIYEKLWDEMLQRYFNTGRFAGQDQCIIGSIYLEHPELFELIKAKTDYGDEWFYLLWYWQN